MRGGFRLQNFPAIQTEDLGSAACGNNPNEMNARLTRLLKLADMSCAQGMWPSFSRNIAPLEILQKLTRLRPQVRCDAASLGVPCTNCVAFAIECKIPVPKRKKTSNSRTKDEERY